ncbi:hypothetical protein Tco_1165657 [Tanacetum coccineum]
MTRKDTIQLEDAVSTISHEYLQEFALEYYISESMHPELPGPEDNIVDFPEGKVGVYTKNFEYANYRIPISQFLFDILDERVFPTVVDWRTSAPKDERPTADSYFAVDVATLNLHLSSETPPVIVKSPLDFSNEESLQLLTEGDETETQVPAVVAPEVPRAENPTATEVVPELNLEKKAAAMGPPLNNRCRKRDKGEAEANVPPKVLRKDHASVHPQPSTSVVLQSVSEPDPLSYAQPQPLPEQDIAQSSKKAAAAEDPDSEKSISFASMGGPPEDIYQPGWGVTNNCRLDTPKACQDMVDHIVPPGYFSLLHHVPNDDFLGQYNVNLERKVAMGSQLRLRFEQEAKLLKKAVARVARRDQRIQAREGQVTGEEKIKAAFEDFKKYEDDRVTSRCSKIDARLDALSIDFDEELYPHMLTAIAGRRWVIGHGLRLAVMKCAESMELRQVFANVVFAGIAKGMSEGLRHGVEHGKAKLDLAAVEAYDPKADDKFTTALQALKDLEYPLVDQLERLKDAPIDLVMASLHLKSDTGEDAPQFIRDLSPSSSQLKIPVYPEKKKKSRVVCRTHEVGSAHHARSDGVPVFVPTVAPQGLKIMLADVATQTEVSEDEGSPRLLRSKCLPHMFNLEWS